MPHRSSPMALGAALVLAALGAARGQAAPDAPMPLLAHQAVYDLSLSKATGDKSPTSAGGRIAFSFTGSRCEGYSTSFRQVTELQPSEGPLRVSDMRSATFEDPTGKDFVFKVQSTVDQNTGPDLDGRAERNAGGDVSVKIARPKPEQLTFGNGTLFPTEHMQRILAAAHANQRVLAAPVYDGSDTGEKSYDTLTVIGAPTTAPPPEAVARVEALKDVRRWPVSISYFESGKADGPPNYVLAFDLYDNGVSRALRLDYGDFVLAGDLVKLDVLPAGTCP